MKTFTTKIITLHHTTTISNTLIVSIPTTDGIEGFKANHQPDSYHTTGGICTITSGASGDVSESFELSQGHVRFENNTLFITAITVTKISVH